MKIKMSQKFNPDEYKPLEELFPEGKACLFTILLDPERSVFQRRKNNIIIPGKKNGPNLESRIKVGKGNQEEDPGKKVKITGFVKYKGIVGIDHFIYQFDLLPNPDSKDDYVRCFVTRRDETRSMMLSGELGYNSINPEQYGAVNLKKDNSTNPTKSKTNPQNHIPITIYGTVQDDGGIYIEIDAAKIGRNPIVYHNKKDRIGIQKRRLIQ